jgi:hypothetical protein
MRVADGTSALIFWLRGLVFILMLSGSGSAFLAKRVAEPLAEEEAR